MKWFLLEQWPPYIVGTGIGILSWIAFLLSDKPLGCSTAYARSSGMIERIVRGDKVLKKPYYQKFAPVVDWEWMLVIGIVIGAFISAIVSGQFQLQWIPDAWAAGFGTSVVLRIIISLIGGIILGFGARWAGGCTSGHGISGTLQLAVSSWLAALCFFIGGIITAKILFTFLPF